MKKFKDQVKKIKVTLSVITNKLGSTVDNKSCTMFKCSFRKS